jgi:hypothetical protein
VPTSKPEIVAILSSDEDDDSDDDDIIAVYKPAKGKRDAACCRFEVCEEDYCQATTSKEDSYSGKLDYSPKELE